MSAEMVTSARAQGTTRALAAELTDVRVEFDVAGRGSVLAVERVDLQVAPGEFVAVVGPSGCGKTTILNMLAGLMKPSAGEVRRFGEVVDKPSRDIGYMLARSALTPWRTARRNVELGLEIQGLGRKERRARAMDLLARLGVDQFADAYPSQLSHGMQQRVAIARTLAIDPSLWLLDEPFGALDAQTRASVQSAFLDTWEGTSKSVILVTHDLTEAVLMADRVVVMSRRPGVVKVDVPIPIDRPRRPLEMAFDPRLDEIGQSIWKELRDELV